MEDHSAPAVELRLALRVLRRAAQWQPAARLELVLRFGRKSLRATTQRADDAGTEQSDQGTLEAALWRPGTARRICLRRVWKREDQPSRWLRNQLRTQLWKRYLQHDPKSAELRERAIGRRKRRASDGEQPGAIRGSGGLTGAVATEQPAPRGPEHPDSANTDVEPIRRA